VSFVDASLRPVPFLARLSGAIAKLTLKSAKDFTLFLFFEYWNDHLITYPTTQHHFDFDKNFLLRGGSIRKTAL